MFDPKYYRSGDHATKIQKVACGKVEVSGSPLSKDNQTNNFNTCSFTITLTYHLITNTKIKLY